MIVSIFHQSRKKSTKNNNEQNVETQLIILLSANVQHSTSGNEMQLPHRCVLLALVDSWVDFRILTRKLCAGAHDLSHEVHLNQIAVFIESNRSVISSIVSQWANRFYSIWMFRVISSHFSFVPNDDDWLAIDELRFDLIFDVPFYLNVVWRMPVSMVHVAKDKLLFKQTINNVLHVKMKNFFCWNNKSQIKDE